MAVVLCSNGYPGNYKKNVELKKLNNIKLTKNNFIFMLEQKILRIKFYQTVVEF